MEKAQNSAIAESISPLRPDPASRPDPTSRPDPACHSFEGRNPPRVNPASNVAIVVCTYKRQDLLQVLFDSYIEQPVLPQNIVIVDNENSAQTAAICEKLQLDLGDITKVTYVPMAKNTGGAGGFSKGVEVAYCLGANWLWLMDDDVKLLDNALGQIERWLDTGVEDDHRVLQVRRLNYDGAPFYWQYQFMNGLGIPNPIAPSGWGATEEYKDMNTGCFEGGFFHRSIVKENGLPDPRFFIYWDDTVYGYLASKLTDPILVNATVMQRTRNLENIKLGHGRKLNSTSDMVRYYIMRNRGYIAQYFKIKGDYNFILFNIGTALTFCKEVVRLFITKSFKTGFPRITAGMRDGRTIRHDKTFKPMSPLV